jgi:hypothetical protein
VIVGEQVGEIGKVPSRSNEPTWSPREPIGASSWRTHGAGMEHDERTIRIS